MFLQFEYQIGLLTCFCTLKYFIVYSVYCSTVFQFSNLSSVIVPILLLAFFLNKCYNTSRTCHSFLNTAIISSGKQSGLTSRLLNSSSHNDQLAIIYCLKILSYELMLWNARLLRCLLGKKFTDYT